MGSKALLPPMNMGLGNTEVSLHATVAARAGLADAPSNIPTAPAEATINFLWVMAVLSISCPEKPGPRQNHSEVMPEASQRVRFGFVTKSQQADCGPITAIAWVSIDAWS
jgi:hypothetical protein